MANYFVNLPAAQMPKNALLDFAGINQSLDGIQRQRNIDRQRGDMLDERGYQRGREAKVDHRQDVDWFSKQAAAIDQMQGPQRAAAWQSYIAKHPDAANLGPQYHDPINGPKIVAAEAGRFNDPLDRQLKQAQVAGVGTSNALHAQQLAQSRVMGPLQAQYLQAQIEQARQKPAEKTMEVNGKVIGIPNSGQPARVIYDGGANFDKLPEFAAKSAGFTSRMVEAEQNVRDVMGNNFDPTSIGTAIARSVPEGIGNYLVRSGDLQRYQQGAEQWIRAFLRKESGAAIGKDEFARDFRVYFPQAGDTPEVIKQKERARFDAMRSFQMETRGYFDHVSPQHAERLKGWGVPQAQQNAPVKVQTPEQAMALPSGTQFMTPDGRVKVRP